MTRFDLETFLGLIRSLFPRWNFFDEVAHHFEISFRMFASSDWTPLSFEQPRTAFSFWLNPMGNLAHAEENLLEHFAADVQALVGEDGMVDSRAIHALSSYQMVRSLVRTRFRDYNLAEGPFQFRVNAVAGSDVTTIYVSDWASLGSVS